MKYIFLIIVLVISGCKQKKFDGCSFSNWEKIPLPNSVSIQIPKDLSAIKDSLNYNFEIDENLLFIKRLYTKDSSSLIKFEVYNAQDSLVSRKSILEYGKEVEAYYKSTYRYINGNYAFQSVDTLDDETLSRFVFMAKEDNNNIIVGGLIFFDKKIKYDILIKLNERNFSDSRNIVECVFNSLNYKK